jgi:threonine synthase
MGKKELKISEYQGVISRYSQYLPINPRYIVTLNEGNTPLLRAPRLAEKICKGIDLYLKFEGLNPTGSFKDRGMTYAVSKAMESGSKAIACASTGNTSASAAAYGARAGLKVVVIIPAGKIALGKLCQALMHGAQVVQIRGNFDQALDIVRTLVETKNCVLVNSINPHRIMGQKTAAYEICDVLNGTPNYHALPVGNAGNITAYWRGYKDYHESGRIKSLPKMLGFQAAGAAPIVKGKIVKRPETIASAIRIGNPANWETAISARDESKGLIDSVNDRQILQAYKYLADTAGYFAEPASAAGLAGLIKLSKKGFFRRGDRVVCTLTGHGLKDPDSAMSIARKPKTYPADIDKVLKVIKV